jgi:hypothetical protein
MKRCASKFLTGLTLVLSLANPFAYLKAESGIELVILKDPVYVRTISGQVQAPDKSPIQNANIELFELKTGKVLASTTTDANGGFHFNDFGKREYKLKISAYGFDPEQATLKIRKTAPALAAFTLVIAT